MLERVGRLVLERGPVRGPRVVVPRDPPGLQGARLVAGLGLATEDQDGLPLHVDARVIVIIQLVRFVSGRDAVTGEDDGRGLERRTDADGQRGKVGLERGGEGLPIWPVEHQFLILGERRVAADRETLEVAVGSRRGLESGLLEDARDVVGRRLNPFRPRLSAFTIIRGQIAHIRLQSLLGGSDGAAGFGHRRLRGFRVFKCPCRTRKHHA